MTKRELSKIYDNNHAEFTKIAQLTRSETETIGWNMYFWRNNHPWAESEQYNRAHKRFIMSIVCDKLNIK